MQRTGTNVKYMYRQGMFFIKKGRGIEVVPDMPCHRFNLTKHYVCLYKIY